MRLHELAAYRNIDRSEQIRGKYEAIRKDAHQHQILTRIVAGDLLPDFLYTSLNLLGAEQDLGCHWSLGSSPSDLAPRTPGLTGRPPRSRADSPSQSPIPPPRSSAP